MRARPSGATTLLLVAGGVFLLLAIAVALGATQAVDTAVRDALLGLESPLVVTAMRIVNYAGEWRVLLPGTLLLVVGCARARARWWLWIVLMLVAPLAETLLKNVVGRPRPEGASLGFPSGHATAAAAFFGAAIYLADSLSPRARRPLRALAALAIVLVALARVILRAHWPSDALAGLCLGLALASAAALLAGPGGAARDP
ncbi:MAG: phosphatase PAP2 family protein [Candidatus Rokubacteria bacterium]|nr:phosphatase PAP2 family protein [Candidatus Rokubacteria bacterium]